MPDDVAFHQKHHAFGNVRGVVGNAFEVSNDAEHRDARIDAARVGLHGLGNFVDDAPVVLVDLEIETDDVAGRFGVDLHEGIERLADHRRDLRGHRFEAIAQRKVRRTGEHGGTLGEIDGEIAHPLEIGADEQDGCDPSQVAGHGVVQRKDRQGFFLDAVFQEIDLGIARHDLLRFGGVALAEGADGVEDGPLDAPGHVEDEIVEAIEIALHMLRHGDTTHRSGESMGSPAFAALTAAIRRSRLIDDIALEAALAACGSDEPESLLHYLRASRELTQFQAEKLSGGFHQGFAIGPYRLLCPLGKGGVGIVYLARDGSIPIGGRRPRLVALKLLSPGKARSEPRLIERFQREIDIGPTIPPHPHLARTLQAGKIAGINLVTMEFVPGRTAKAAVKDDGPMALPVAARLAADVARGLHAAHAAGFVHRDTKPSNIMVLPNGRAKLLDFGFALHRGESPNADPRIVGGRGYTLGTIDYMPPEQAANAVAVGAETDLYSLGCSLYYLLSGRVPFPTGTTQQKIVQHRKAQPRPLAELAPNVPGDAIRLIRWLMAKRPEDRPQSAEFVADELERYATPAIPTAEMLRHDEAWEWMMIERAEAAWMAARA